MAIWDPPAEIGILLYPGVASATVHGLTDLFTVASTLARQHMGPTAPMLRVSHWQPDSVNDEIDRVFDSHPGLAHRPVAVIVPGSWSGPPALRRDPMPRQMADRAPSRGRDPVLGLRRCVRAGRDRLAREALRDHALELSPRTLAERFPDIHVDECSITVEDGNFITAGGVLAWADLGLKLVDRHLGPTIMLETARFMLVDPPGREQRYYSNFSPKLHHGDAAVLKVQHWLQAEAANQPTVAEMAEISGLEARTFLRRFRKGTGLNPTEYSQRLRVGKARAMLEFTNQPISQVALAVGYEDSGSFRKVFQKVVGLSPSDYRRRFAVA